MCGIVGYIGQKKAYPILIKGLKRLEYRGYDSAGVALISDNRQLNVYKTKGKVSELETFVTQKDISGNIGIAHTRWATHGEPCSANAHPHYSSSERLALIHNGIIENYAVLKEKLQAKGYSFKSSTDTEVLVQLIEFIQKSKNTDLLTAVQLALREVIGAYAIAVLDKDNPDEIIAARKSSPLVVGIGEDEFFLLRMLRLSWNIRIKWCIWKMKRLRDTPRGETESGEPEKCGVSPRSENGGAEPGTVGERRISALHAERNLRATRLHSRLYAWAHQCGEYERGAFRRDRL